MNINKKERFCDVDNIVEWRHIITILIVLVLSSCHPSAHYPQVLLEADSLTIHKPYLAKELLMKMEQQMEGEPEEVRMYYLLLKIKAKDRNFEPHTSDSIILKLVSYYERKPNHDLLKQAYYYAARTYISLKDATLAEEYLEKALNVEGSLSNSQILWWMGDLYRNQGLYDMAIESFHQALDNEQPKDSIEQMIDMFALGNTYREMERYDSCIHYMQETYKMAKNSNDTSLMRTSSKAIADMAVKHGQYNYARHILGNLLPHVSESKDGDLLMTAANLYVKTGQRDSAYMIYQRLAGLPLTTRMKLDVYKNLLSLNLKRGNMAEAYGNLLYYEHLDDTVHKDDLSATLLKMKSVYDYRVREKHNEELIIANEHKKLWIVSISTLLVLILVLLFWAINYYRQKQVILNFKVKERDELIANYLQKNKQKKATEREKIERSEIYQTIIETIKQGYHLTEKDWQQLEQTVNGVFPHFNARLSELCKMGHHDYHVCLLIKVGLQPKDIANLTDHSPESVSSTRRRLYIRAFGQKGTPKDWDSVVLSL